VFNGDIMQKPKIIKRNLPTVASRSTYGSAPEDDRFTVIIDGVATNLTAASFTVYKRKAAMIMDTDSFPCVIVSPSEDGEITGMMALNGWTEFKYQVKVFYVEKYNRDLTYESLTQRTDIRKIIYKLGNVSGMLSPTTVDVKGVPPFNIDGINTVWKVTGFRLIYGFLEQGDI
jgi:hypothetical protein